MKKTQLTFTTWRDVDRAVTNSEIKLRVVVRTFNVLKHKIFGGCSFAVVEDTPEQKTYSAILQYLRPEFRTN